jgi:hypothetical protein
MLSSQVKSPAASPMTLGKAAAAQVRLIVWCKGCGHQVEPDHVEMAARYGADTSVPDWKRLVSLSAQAVQAGLITGERPSEGCATCGKSASHRS